MKVLLQRVKRASVEVDGETVGKIGIGALVFVGIAAGDTPEQVHILARKTLGLRMFPDVRQVMNLNVMGCGCGAVGGISIYACCRHR